MNDLDLEQLARELTASHEALIDAEAKVEADKRLRRNSGLRARLVDLFTETPVEHELAVRSEAYRLVKARIHQELSLWFRNETMRLVQSSPVAGEHSRTEASLVTLESRLAKARKWVDLARDASDALEHAQDQCESASNTEMLDMVTSSKAISLVSSMDTSSARIAVSDAQNAVKSLKEALPTRTQQSEISVPDDLVDLTLDFVFAPTIDFLSFMNMNSLDSAASKCDEIRRAIEPLSARLDVLVTNLREKKSETLKLLSYIEAPFMEQIKVRIPVAFRELLPGQ